jgi:hypothetical protein
MSLTKTFERRIEAHWSLWIPRHCDSLAQLPLAATPRRCPLWVKSGHRNRSAECPLYLQEQTLELCRVMSALCQKRTLLKRESPLREIAGGTGKRVQERSTNARA